MVCFWEIFENVVNSTSSQESFRISNLILRDLIRNSKFKIFRNEVNLVTCFGCDSFMNECLKRINLWALKYFFFIIYFSYVSDVLLTTSLFTNTIIGIRYRKHLLLVGLKNNSKLELYQNNIFFHCCLGRYSLSRWPSYRSLM